MFLYYSLTSPPLPKPVHSACCPGTQISMNARAVAGVNEVNCLGTLGCGMLGQLNSNRYQMLQLHRRMLGGKPCIYRSCVSVLLSFRL